MVPKYRVYEEKVHSKKKNIDAPYWIEQQLSAKFKAQPRETFRLGKALCERSNEYGLIFTQSLFRYLLECSWKTRSQGIENTRKLIENFWLLKVAEINQALRPILPTIFPEFSAVSSLPAAETANDF